MHVCIMADARTDSLGRIQFPKTLNCDLFYSRGVLVSSEIDDLRLLTVMSLFFI